MVSWTSWLPAGPVIARIFLFPANWWATASAWAVFGSWVSPGMRRSFSLCDLFHRFWAYLAQWYCRTPIEAASPVAGYATPIVTVLPHLTFVVAPALADALAGALAEPQAVVETATANAAATATTAPTLFNIPCPPLGDVLRVRRSPPAEVCAEPEELARDSTPLHVS